VGLREGDRKGGDPPPLKWSDLRYVFDIKEDCNGKRTDPRNTVSTVSRVSDININSTSGSTFAI
jgi:hypothetical protein